MTEQMSTKFRKESKKETKFFDWKDRYITYRNYLNTGRSELEMVKGLTTVLFLFSGLAFLYELPYWVAVVGTVVYLLVSFGLGYYYYECGRLYQRDVEWQNQRHKGIKVKP